MWEVSVITKAERAELRSVVRQQFKVLRDEVDQREAELVADIERQIADDWSERDEQVDVVKEEAQRLADEANRALREFVKAHPERGDLSVYGFTPPEVRHRQEAAQQRHRLRAAAVADLKARVGAAHVKLGRQEADLLRTLAVGALESDEARAFLSEIPSVAELVPASRLREIEAGLGGDQI
jgi:type II secretory pathway predicted ATPase ExeA